MRRLGWLVPMLPIMAAHGGAEELSGDPEAGARRRGRGLGRALVAQVIGHAQGRVAQLHATVVTGNAVAGGLYRDLGFVTYGVEPRALKVGERYFDQALMVLMLDDVH